MAKYKGPACYHCGEDCGSNPIMYDEKPFCCTGCSAVYQILSENEACEYYNIEKTPGIRPDIQTEIGNKYAYLDNEEIKKEMLDFSDGGISKVKFFVPSIHCSSCIWLLENLHRLNKAVINSTVNFIKKEVRITFRDTDLSLRQLVELMVSVNYVPHITLDDLQNKTEKKADKSIYYKLGVAGFCFGNIMLLSFPEYLNFNEHLEDKYRTTFAWLNFTLVLPVVFYASTGYFVSAFKSLRKKVINIDLPISLGIIVLFVRSTYELIEGIDVGYFDSLAGLIFFLLIGKWYQSKTYQALSFERNYKSYFPVAVSTLDENDEEVAIPLKQLKVGQRIRIRNQELIPADAILLKGQANIDYSFVSGESTPVLKKEKELIYAGGRQIGSAIDLIVEKEVTQSYLTELWNQDIQSEKDESKLNTLVNNVSHYFTIVVILTSVISGAYWLIFKPENAMNAFTSVLIIACPCALALTLPFAFGSAIRIFGRAGFYLKKTDIVERLSKIDTIVFDKTGTLTQNEVFEIDTSNIDLKEEELVWIKSAVHHSTHPLSIAVYKYLKQQVIPVDHYEEVPSAGIKVRIQGHDLLIGSKQLTDGIEKLDGTYSSRVFVKIDGESKGYFNIRNAYRPGIENVIGHLKKDFDLHILSGDNASEKEVLSKLFPAADQIHFDQTPKSKLEYIRKLQAEGKRVMMMGDGLNDAGALSESDVGISIADNIYHFSPACDAILESQKFASLERFIRYSKSSMNIIKMSFVISFLYNIVGLTFAVQAFLTPIFSAILMPVSSVTVVAFITLTSATIAKRKKLK